LAEEVTLPSLRELFGFSLKKKRNPQVPFFVDASFA
jgi:hypothetical protein